MTPAAPTRQQGQLGIGVGAEREDHLDVIRLLGEKQDVAGILMSCGTPSAHEPMAGYLR
jgi:hypothetical protein